MARYRVELKSTVLIDIDESKFTEAFMAEYRKYFDSSFYEISQFAEHLADLNLREVAENGDFVEGYGNIEERGIKFVGWPETNTQAILRDGKPI
ncbi:hypothetical protein ACQU0X_06570 [Pseudovibrio ascidiaceicola]|uniref:hypothetical protein n=1 Tax=Pseudovibrio ascidiaceicola TaxID=285279 RepID=UPI003D362AF2